jgi:hypothetical protein
MIQASEWRSAKLVSIEHKQNDTKSKGTKKKYTKEKGIKLNGIKQKDTR